MASGDQEELAALMDLRRTLDEAIVAGVAGLKSSGVTWRSIGEATGTSHVAAIQKWGDRAKALTA